MINIQLNPEFTKQLNVVIDSLQKLNSINTLIKDDGSKVPLPFIRPDTLKTDLQKFKDLYDIIGVEYTFNGNCIWLRQNERTIIGNDNCKSVIYFDRKGRFVKQGFFE